MSQFLSKNIFFNIFGPYNYLNSYLSHICVRAISNVINRQSCESLIEENAKHMALPAAWMGGHAFLTVKINLC